MSNYSIAFISNEAITRSYANEFFAEECFPKCKVASSINSKRLDNFKIDFCLIDVSKNLENLRDLKEFFKNNKTKQIIVFHSRNNLDEIKQLIGEEDVRIIFREVDKANTREFFRKQLLELVKSLATSHSDGLLDLREFTPPNAFDLILLGASTGGPEAVKQIIGQLKTNMPPILIVLHMQPEFVERYCERLKRITPLNVIRFGEHQKIGPNSIYIAAGSNHMEISKTGSDYFLNKGNKSKINGHCPSVDVLFKSAAKIYDTKILAVLLTGMGSDGAEGLNLLKNSGAFTITQNEETSEVYGMPKAAIEMGAAKRILSLEQIIKILSK